MITSVILILSTLISKNTVLNNKSQIQAKLHITIHDI